MLLEKKNVSLISSMMGLIEIRQLIDTKSNRNFSLLRAAERPRREGLFAKEFAKSFHKINSFTVQFSSFKKSRLAI